MKDITYGFFMGAGLIIIIWFIFAQFEFSYNEYSEEAIVTINTQEDINGFEFSIDNYTSGKNNKLNLRKIINDYTEYINNY